VRSPTTVAGLAVVEDVQIIAGRVGCLDAGLPTLVNAEEWRAPTAEARSRLVGRHRSKIDGIKANWTCLSIYTFRGQSHLPGPESGAKRLSTVNASNEPESLEFE
jgi:hypothetical protein